MINEIIKKANCYAAEICFAQKYIMPDNYYARVQFIANDLMKDCQQLVIAQIHSKGFARGLYHELLPLIASATQLSCDNLYEVLFKPLLDKCPASELTAKNIQGLLAECPDQLVEISSHPRLYTAQAVANSPSPTMSHDSAIELDDGGPQAKRVCYNPIHDQASLLAGASGVDLYCDEELL